MKTASIFVTLLAITILYGCNKDKFTTVPQVKIRDISPGEVFQGNIVRLRGSFTDQEGDLDSVLVVYKWYNDVLVTRKDTFRYSIENLGVPAKLREGDLFVELGYGQVDGYVTLGGTPVAKDTSVTIGLVLKDKEKNRSDYAESDRIRFRKP
jgi:hypothetical protein